MSHPSEKIKICCTIAADIDDEQQSISRFVFLFLIKLKDLTKQYIHIAVLKLIDCLVVWLSFFFFFFFDFFVGFLFGWVFNFVFVVVFFFVGGCFVLFFVCFVCCCLFCLFFFRFHKEDFKGIMIITLCE